MKGETTTECCKVGRDIVKYELGEFNAKLRQRRSDGTSLRGLAEFMNIRILEKALSDVQFEVVSDAETIYQILRGDDVRTSRRVEIRSKLSQRGLNIEAIENDFVSHQTIRDHLKTCLEVDTGQQLHVEFEQERGTIEWARARSEKVIQRSLERLRQAEELDTGPLDITHSIRVVCEDCGESYRLRNLLERGRCECTSDQRNE